jgi:hypothetical protein
MGFLTLNAIARGVEAEYLLHECLAPDFDIVLPGGAIRQMLEVDQALF